MKVKEGYKMTKEYMILAFASAAAHPGHELLIKCDN
jgi:hypothetical protein